MSDLLGEHYASGGVFYDYSSGEFCRIAEGEGTVCLLEPDTEDIYYEIDAEDWEVEKDDFVKLSQDAVDDPATYFENAVNRLIEEARDIDLAVLYARERCEIVED